MRSVVAVAGVFNQGILDLPLPEQITESLPTDGTTVKFPIGQQTRGQIGPNLPPVHVECR